MCTDDVLWMIIECCADRVLTSDAARCLLTDDKHGANTWVVHTAPPVIVLSIANINVASCYRDAAFSKVYASQVSE